MVTRAMVTRAMVTASIPCASGRSRETPVFLKRLPHQQVALIRRRPNLLDLLAVRAGLSTK